MLSEQKVSPNDVAAACLLLGLNKLPTNAGDVRQAWGVAMMAVHPDLHYGDFAKTIDVNAYKLARDLLIRAIEERDSE